EFLFLAEHRDCQSWARPLETCHQTLRLRGWLEKVGTHVELPHQNAWPEQNAAPAGSDISKSWRKTGQFDSPASVPGHRLKKQIRAICKLLHSLFLSAAASAASSTQ